MKKKLPRKDKPQLDKARVLEALAENPQQTKRDLAHVLHVSGNEYFSAVTPWQAGGLSASRYDNSIVAHQSAAMHLASLARWEVGGVGL